MPDEPNLQQPISDDQELAKVLAGVSQEADDAATVQDNTPPVAPSVADPAVDTSQDDTAPATDVSTVTPVIEPLQSNPVSAVPAPGGELDGIKLEALNELRPLVDKLNVSPEEKFDTYLLLLRSTDDKALIAPAHDAAKGIADEARRAQALLDIIKEIDFLSQSQQQ